MPIIYDNTKIKLIYLDTNAISEFISNTNNFMINLEKNLVLVIVNFALI